MMPLCRYMTGCRTTAVRLLLWLVFVLAMRAAEPPGNWSGNYLPCDGRSEVLKPGHMNLGVRFSTADPGLVTKFMRAMDFWATILDMEWHYEDSQACSIQIVDGGPDLFLPTQVARAQFPGSPVFQGCIAFNPNIDVTGSEKFIAAVHELGHLLGLKHNPRPDSVMFYLQLDGPAILDVVDLTALAAHHKLRIARLDQPVIVNASKLSERSEW